MNQLKHVCFLCSCLILAACANRQVGLVHPDFGNALQQNFASETVNPTAPTDRAPLTMNGARAALQQLHYLNDTVEKPANIGTQTAGTGSGGGGGGGGGGGSGSGASAGAGAAAAAR